MCGGHSGCAAIGAPELGDDPRFATNRLRVTNRDELVGMLAAIMRQGRRDDWIAKLEAVGVPCGPINDFGQAMQDPHYLARGMVQELEHPALGRMKTIGIPTKFSRTPGSLRSAAPLMGQHTDEVLRRFGVPEDRIAGMRARGVIA